MFKIIRIAVLLCVLGSVASTLLIQRNVVRDWSGTLDIQIIPVIADKKSNTQAYVESLKERDFDSINRYLITQAKRFNVDLNYSLSINVTAPTFNVPPAVPSHDASRISIMLWSLKLKWWAWRNQAKDHKLSQIRLYVLYQSPEDSTPLPHSTGLRNGLIGLINARANHSQRTLHPIIITHELLHILGASDQYNLSTGEPLYPNGYAEPNKEPLLPQRFTSIMARAKQINSSKFEVATHLRQTVINEVTASEIGWLRPSQ